MKRFCYSWCLMFLTSIAFGQTTATFNPEVTPAGVYFNIGVLPIKGEIGLVERDKGKGFETIGSLSAPTSKAMLYQRMLNYSLRFSNYYSVTERLSTNIWQLMQAGKQDSIQKGAVPVMLLALGSAFLDTAANLPPNTRYRVQMGNRKLESSSLATSKVTTKAKQIVFYELKPASQAIRAEWRLKNGQQPALLEVQRKRIGIDSNFVKMNTNLGYEKTKQGDSLRIHLSDTTVLSGISYLYFLSGKDFLGRVMTNSDTIRSIAGNRATVNGITKLTTKSAPDSSGVQLFWNKQDVNAIRSIRVFRSPYYDSAYVQITVLPPTDTSWVDRSAAIGANYYYQLVAQGDGDFAYPSSRVFGSFINDQRLVPPTGVQATNDTNGTKLKWKYSTYLNLLGFRVYRALGNSGKFEAISDVLSAPRDTLQFSFIDKDKALNANQFYSYAVAAVSRSFKESPLSTIVQFNTNQKKQLTAPSQVRSIQLNDSTVLITWQDMAKADGGMSSYHVYKKALNADSSKGFIRITKDLLRSTNEFTDTPGVGTSWQYVVRSVNQADSSAYSLPVVVTLVGNKPLPPGKVRVFNQKDKVVINWDPTLIPDITQYHIYRAAVGKPLTRIGTVAAKVNTFEDKEIQKGALYFYYVTTENSQKIESNRSTEISTRL